MNFTDEQIERYNRQIILRDVGPEGQLKISQSKVLIIGAGGLGSPVALYLAAAGIGKIGIVDDDIVDLGNLQRQILHHTKDVGVPKVISANQSIQNINPDIRVVPYQLRLTADNIEEIINGYDFIVDGSDNFATKYLINDMCNKKSIPFSHAGILKFDGQLLTVVPGESACYRCVFPQIPSQRSIPTCSQAGILGPVAGVIGTLQATEVLKFILGKGDLLTNRLLLFSALEMKFREIRVPQQHYCEICGTSEKTSDKQ